MLEAGAAVASGEAAGAEEQAECPVWRDCAAVAELQDLRAKRVGAPGVEKML